MLTEEQIIKFEKLHQNRFGKGISREDAYEQAVKLFKLVELIYKPNAENECNHLQNLHGSKICEKGGKDYG